MNDLVIASTPADAAAAEAIEQHHAQLAGALHAHVDTLVGALSRMDGDAALVARDDLVAWARRELVPHALAEEDAMYPVVHERPATRLLVDAMLAEHAVLVRLVDETADAADAVRAGVAAGALLELFESHLSKENDQLLPVLMSSPDVDLSAILGAMHEHLVEAAPGDPAEEGHGVHHASGGHGGHDCTCGEVDGPGYPELDARAIPHAIRHATIFGALDTVGQGSGLVLVAPHDPLPLLGQIEQRYDGQFSAEYLERGPEAWRLALVRRSA
jgi:uncharacterized protein (DUF2249 family)